MKNKLKRLLICLLAAGISLVGTTTVSQAAAKRPRLNICNLNLTVSSQFRLRVYNLNKKMRVTYTSSDKKIADISEKAKKGKRLLLQPIQLVPATLPLPLNAVKKQCAA